MKESIRPLFHTNCGLWIITVRNEVAKVMFLHVSVILSTEGVLLSQLHCRWYPSMPCSTGGVLSQHALVRDFEDLDLVYLEFILKIHNRCTIANTSKIQLIV